MPTTSTTISTSRDGDLSRNSTAGMDVRQRNQILATLRNTGMFFKKLSFGRRRAMPQMNDDMNASMFTRTDHTVQLGQKAFNMSQPTLGMHISPSVILDNEDHSDISHTGSSSPSSSSQINQRRVEFVTKACQNGVQHPQALIPGVQVNSHRPLSNGLPPILEPPPKAVDGLVSSTDPLTSSLLTEAAARAAARDSPPKPYLQVSHSVQSVPATVSDSASTIFQDAPCCVNGDCEQCRQLAQAQTDVQAPSGLITESPTLIPDTSGEATPQPLLLQAPQIRLTQSLPSRRIQAPSLTSSASQSPSVNSSSGQATPQSTSGEPTPRALHPRLASLPPPMMARFATQGSARLTPSIIPRPPPMPLLNLPTLPPPTPPSTSVTQSSHTRLRSMPALPHCGPSDLDVRSGDHDSAGIDEMEDLDEEDEDSENVNDEASEDEPSPSSLDIEAPPDMTPRLRVPLPPSISRSRPGSQRLPSIDTSPFALEFGEGSSTAQQTARSSPNVGNRGTVYLTPVEPVAGPSILNTQTPKPPTIERTPASPTDYFNVRTHEVQSQSTDQGGSGAQKDPSRTPRPVDFNDFVPQTVPMPSSSPRPMLTHHTSKSMSDLLTMNGWKDKPKPKENGTATTRVVDAPDYGLATTRDTPPDDAGPSTTPAKRETPPTVRRQRSLPMFTNATDPPPYPDFSPFKHAPPVVPREEEGKERLPPYTNQIYLAAIMPRKMEFDAPGVQSRDRKWKRALCVLEGTAFKVYKVHASVVGDWWERTVGVGDKTSVDPGSVGNAGAIRVSAIRESARQGRAGEAGDGSPKIDPTGPVREERNNGDPSTVHAANTTSIPPSRSKLSLAASLLNPKRHRDRSVDRLGGSSQSSSSRLSIDIPQEENHRSSNGISTMRRSLDSGRSPSRMASTSELSSSRSTNGNRRVSSFATTSASSDSSPSSPLPPATSHFSHLSHHNNVMEQELDRKDLLRQYSMQHAESGLASDYLKRKNVIRVRMEGEQFLLQARDVPAVIDWIEGIQAATNIALDLDERPMPKGPMFPRRRRRRPRRPADNANPSGANANDASASSASSSARPS